MLADPGTIKFIIALILGGAVFLICKFFAKKIDGSTFELAGSSSREHILGKFAGFRKWSSALFFILMFIAVIGTKIYPDFSMKIFGMFLIVFFVYLFCCHQVMRKLSSKFRLSTNLIDRIVLARHLEQLSLILPFLVLYSLWFIALNI